MSTNLKPSVNGISPKEGTPGTKLTIRGENLGTSAADILHIFLGKIDVGCSVQWHSSKKLNIITSFGEGELKIIVVTKSQGQGTCDVEYFQTVSQSVGLQEPVSYWPPNEHKQHQVLMSYSKRTQPKHLQSEMIEDIQDVMLGHHNLPTNFALSDDELVKFYKGRGSTALTEPDFNPVLFLLKYHCHTNYSDLVRTLDNYRTVMANDKMKEPISIVKANLYTIFQCLECLETLKKKIDDEKTTTREMSGAFAETNLLAKLEDSKSIAHHMYEEVLKRRDYADSVRSALSVMQRFRFLFNLPHSIRENISKGEYNLVINDYLRARSLFGSSEIRLFQQVYKDVVEVIDKFKELLRRQLLEMPKKCDAVKVTIRLLRQLEVDYDPTWACLENQRDWILQSTRKLNASAFACQTRMESKPLLHKNTARNATVQLVDELNKLLCDTFNETWSLVCYYVEEQPSGGKSRSSSATDDKRSNHRQRAVEKIVHSIVLAYATKMRDTLSHNSLTSGWLVYCLQHVRTAFESLAMGEIPSTSSSVLIGLLAELREQSVRVVLAHAEQDIVSLAARENWNTEITDRLGAVTRLPALYRNIMLNSFSEISRIMHSRHRMEPPVCDSADEQQQFANWVSAAMRAFIACTDAILDKLHARNSGQANSAADTNNSSSDTSPSEQGASPDLNVPSVTVSRILLMANNCHYCMTDINVDIVSQMRHQNLPNADDVMRDVQASFGALHTRLVGMYTDMRLDTLLAQVAVGMRASNYDWKAVPEATAARGYVHSVLAGLAQAHCELELISPNLSRDCVVKMIVRVVEEVNRVVEASDRREWSRRGHMQLVVDLSVLEAVLLALSPDKCGDAALALSREATSLMNIMRGAYRLVTDEQAAIKASLARERLSFSLLIQGFQESAN